MLPQRRMVSRAMNKFTLRVLLMLVALTHRRAEDRIDYSKYDSFRKSLKPLSYFVPALRLNQILSIILIFAIGPKNLDFHVEKSKILTLS